MKKISTILAATMLAGGLCAYAEKEERKKGGPPEGRPSREELLKKFDKDGDGKLNDAERAELRKAMASKGGARRLPPQLMKKFDKDGDGKLNEDERAEMRKAMEARRKEFIAKFDKDGDGKLNEDERKAAMAARPKPGARPGGKPGAKKPKGGKKGGKKKGADSES